MLEGFLGNDTFLEGLKVRSGISLKDIERRTRIRLLSGIENLRMVINAIINKFGLQFLYAFLNVFFLRVVNDLR